jgi:two-component system chemotaxis sensor kinase CheA
VTDPVDLREFIGGFVVEADELVASASVALLEIETANAAGSSRPRAVRELFRALHTIKGLAGMIGVEPIVEISHALETLVRTADRGGGVLRRGAVDVALQGIAAIAVRVRAVAARRTVEPLPEALLAAIAAVDVRPEPVVETPLALEWHDRLAPGERMQLAIGLRDGGRALAVTFAPSEANVARGVTIASVRARLAEQGDVIKVVPRATPDQASTVAFDILLVTTAATTLIAEIAATTADRLVELVAPTPRSSDDSAELASTDELDPVEDTTALGRSVVRVELARLDELQEQLSLLIVARFRLEREISAQVERGADVRQLREISALQGRLLRDLRRAILRARMVRVAEVMAPLSLLVRSLSRSAGNEVQLELGAGDAEVDKTVADRLMPALIHLVRNAVDHAIEPASERVARGKPRSGTISVSCSEIAGNRVEIVVADDGRGIDRAAVARRATCAVETDLDLLEVLTTPGFTTRDVVSRTSGRGLGMDIVRRIANTDLGGELALTTTPGVGTSFVLRVPVTIAVLEVFSFECGGQTFVVPVSSVEEIFEIAADQITQPPAAPGASSPVRLIERRGQAVPILALGTLLAIDSGAAARKAMVIRRNGEPIGFAVDRMLGRHEVVVRPMSDQLVRAPGISGATDLGDGRPTLVLDLFALGESARERQM